MNSKPNNVATVQTPTVDKQTSKNPGLGTIDAIGARLGRGSAMNLLSISEDELLGGIRNDPNLMVFINQMHQFSVAHAKDLARWAEVMREVSEHAQAVSDRVKREMPGVWFSTRSHSGIDVGLSGTA